MSKQNTDEKVKLFREKEAKKSELIKEIKDLKWQLHIKEKQLDRFYDDFHMLCMIAKDNRSAVIELKVFDAIEKLNDKVNYFEDSLNCKYPRVKFAEIPKTLDSMGFQHFEKILIVGFHNFLFERHDTLFGKELNAYILIVERDE